MRVTLIVILTVAGIGLVGVSTTSAAPVNNTAVIGAAATTSPVEQVRRYCYRHWTYTSRRRFLHWGHC